MNKTCISKHWKLEKISPKKPIYSEYFLIKTDFRLWYSGYSRISAELQERIIIENKFSNAMQHLLHLLSPEGCFNIPSPRATHSRWKTDSSF